MAELHSRLQPQQGFATELWLSVSGRNGDHHLDQLQLRQVREFQRFADCLARIRFLQSHADIELLAAELRHPGIRPRHKTQQT